MKKLLPFLTSLGICAATALPSYSLSVAESSTPTTDYYTTRNLITSSWTDANIQGFKQQIRQEACSFGETRTLLENGITLRYRFWTPDGQLLKTWLLASTAVNCNSTESFPLQVISPSQENSQNPSETQPKQPIQPIGHLQLGMIVIILGTIVTAIAKSSQSTPTTPRKRFTSSSKVNSNFSVTNTISCFSSPSPSCYIHNKSRKKVSIHK
ncbi:MAG: hypothetical protein AB4041_16845 [Microcystaceae cyanobacterium]